MKRDLVRSANLRACNPTAVDVIDRVLDKGIVVEYLVDRVSLIGVDIPVKVHAGFVVASLDTYVERGQQDLLRGTNGSLQDTTIR